MYIKAIIISLFSLIPGIIMYFMGRNKKTSLVSVLSLFVCGILSGFVLRVLERVVLKIIKAMFSEQAYQLFLEHDISSYTTEAVIFIVLCCFVDAALLEEGVKFSILAMFQRKFKTIKNVYDGIMCSFCVSFGFAIYENFMYTVVEGAKIGFARVFASVPGHIFYGIIMGICFSFYIARKKAADEEKNLIRTGKITAVKKPVNYVLPLCLSLAVPILIHGLSDIITQVGGRVSVYLFLLDEVFTYVLSIFMVLRFSKNNWSLDEYANKLLAKKYPDVYENNISEEYEEQ